MRSGVLTQMIIVVASLVGAIDAAIGRTWDLVVLQAVVAVLGAGLLLRIPRGRRTVRIRADLGRWLATYGAEGGEAADAVADRAVAAYRDGLLGEDHRDARAGRSD